MSSPFSKRFARLQIPLADIRSATNSFSDTNLLGENAFRKSYKGKLSQFEQQTDIDIVAERLLGKDEAKKAILQTEISTVCSLNHENVVSIVGFCDEEDEKIIIYNHEANGSLAEHLANRSLTWMQRLEICIGVARALRYIHYDKKRNFSLIHHNINSSQILLDLNWNPKLSGFEFSKIITTARRNRLYVTDHSGTKGYIDPRYEETGGVTHKTDVYSLGVVLFEVLCRRRAYLPTKRSAYSAKQLESLRLVSSLDQSFDQYYGASSIQSMKQELPAFKENMDGTIERAAGRPSSQFAKHHSSEGSLDVVGQPDDIVNHVPQLAKQHSKLDEGRSSQLVKQHSTKRLVVGKMYEVVEGERLSVKTANKHSSHESLDIAGISDEMANYEGPPPQLAKYSMEGFLNVTGILNESIDQVRHSSRSPSTHLDVGPVPEPSSDTFNRPLSFSALQDMRPLSFSNLHFGSRPDSGSNMDFRRPVLGSDMNYKDPLSGMDDMSYQRPLRMIDPDNPYQLSGLDRHIPYHATGSFSDYIRVKPFSDIGFQFLAPFAVRHYERRTLDIMTGRTLKNQMDLESFKTISATAYDCLKEERAERPHIDQIIVRLEKALHLQRKYENSEKSVDAAAQVESTSTNHLKWKGMEHLMIGIDSIKEATKTFTESYIGSGAFGNVYKAQLQHFDNEKFSAVEVKNLSDLPKISSTVAVKVLVKRKGTQADKSFFAEIQTLTSCKHPNIVSLLGFCDEDSKMILIYEYVPNGSLDDHLRGIYKLINLKWVMRLQICLDIAEGLNYLHSQKKIIHRDIKSANILLDDKCRAKIADFGLSKIIPERQELTYLQTKVAGTLVYLDPEYTNTKILRTASDIYSLGVVLFEIVSGTLAYDPRYTKENPQGLAHFARQYAKMGTLTSLLDPILKEEIDENNFTLSKGPNQGSLKTLLNIAHKCLAETHANRPNIGDVINKIKDALKLQENHKDNLKISLEDIKSATNDFSDINLVAKGGSARVYRGDVTRANRSHIIAAKRLDSSGGQHRNEFLMELEILQDYKDDSVIGLVGFCNEKAENIIVYEFPSRGSLDMHLKDYDLTWMKRLQISIDIAKGLSFLHGSRGDTEELVMHRDIKSASILLTDDWKAKICDFGLSLISPINSEMDFANDNACGAIDYRDPLYSKFGYLTEHSDIYSCGVVLIEILCGRLVHEDKNLQIPVLTGLFKDHYIKRALDDIMFEGIKGRAVPESLTTFQEIAHRCLYHEREKRPTAGDLLVELRKALEIQEDHDIWKTKLPSDYEKIFKMSKSCDVYSTKKNQDLYGMLSKGILLQHDKVFFSLGNNGERNEMISARKFLYEYRRSYVWRSIPKSRFHKVVELSDPSNLNFRINITAQLLACGVNYSVHLVFKFCGPQKPLANGMYVNLKYKLGNETLHAYFATWREDKWMTTELCRFSNYKDDADFEFLLESFSRCYCGSRAVYIEGIEFRAIDNIVKHEETENLKEVQQVLESNLNREQLDQVSSNAEKLVWRFEKSEKSEKLFSGTKVNKMEGYMLSAKEALHESSEVMLFNSKSSAQSRLQEEFELPSQQVFRFKCKIEIQRLSPDKEYACYLVFKLSEHCHGLHCPVIVRDLFHRKNKEKGIIYFRYPNPSNVNDAIQVPEEREDRWMEVNVWQFNSTNELRDNCVSVSLKLITYEGTMFGLIVRGLEFRPL